MNVKRVLRAHGRAARLELLGRALAPALAHLIERDRARARAPRGAPLVAAPPAGGSMTMTVRRFGSWSRIAAIFASCSSSSQTIAQASESEMTHRHSSGELVW